MVDPRSDRKVIGAAVAALVSFVSICIGADRADTPAPAGQAALDYAFEFASAIQDAKDQGKAQASVVLDYAAIDATERALERAARVQGWRRATVLADLATHMAKEGQTEPALTTLARAEEAGARVPGWEGPRVSAHVAQALAEMGQSDRSERLARDLVARDSRQYAGRSAATIAAGRAAGGRFDSAMAELDALDGQADFEAAWWRTAGYLGIARQTKLTADQRGRALDAARLSATKISGWKRAEALESIAEEYRLRGNAEAARVALEQAEADVLPLPESLSIKAPLFSNLARTWARLGSRDHARELLAAAEAAVPHALVIDQPAIWANLASSHLSAQDEPRAWALYDRALAAAQELANARPRALALVDVLRSIGRNNLALPAATRGRLDTLLAGLGEPW